MHGMDFGKLFPCGIAVGVVLGALALLVGMWIGNHVDLTVR